MADNINIFSLSKIEIGNLKESSINFDFKELRKNVKFKETSTHLYIYNFPSAFGNTQNKNNRIYEQESLKGATEQFQSIKVDNPYFSYIFDGHRDEDGYENIIGKILDLKIDETHKCILSDLKINKGAKSYSAISNIVKDGDPIGISMRIISPEVMTLSKSEILNLNNDIFQLEDDNSEIAELMSNENEIEYISGKAYIWRFDLTWFPSFNNTFVTKFGKNESVVKAFSEYKKASCLMAKEDKCLTDSCKFKHTIQDFIKLISKDESITSIKTHPQLYEDMLNFSYMNLSEFDFDKMSDFDYLKEKLKNFQVDINDVEKQSRTIENIVGKNNILNYIKNDNINPVLYINILQNTILKMVDVDDIFYQIITTNYLHWILLSTLILTRTSENKYIIDNKKFIKNLEETTNLQDMNMDIVVKFINSLSDNITIYQFTNAIFTYIYSYINRFSNEIAPVAVINESFARFKKITTKSLFKQSFVKK